MFELGVRGIARGPGTSWWFIRGREASWWFIGGGGRWTSITATFSASLLCEKCQLRFNIVNIVRRGDDSGGGVDGGAGSDDIGLVEYAE